jgi:hypothetical protein
VLAETQQRDAGDTTWDNFEKTEYEYNPMSWLKFEGRSQYSGSWSVVYDITQTYDKNGNRSTYDKNVAGGQGGNFGRSENLAYTYDNNNRLTLITDSDDSSYNCIVTPDANGNLTQIEEQGKFGAAVQSTLLQEFQYDDLNRMTSYKTTRYDSVAAKTKYVRRQHEYDATGRLVNSTLKQWETGQGEPGGDTVEHTYAGSKPLQNFDGTSTYGARWVFAGAQHSHGPLKSPAPDTASQSDYNTGTRWQPNRRTYQAATAATEGDQRVPYGQGRPSAKDAAGSGANWEVGTTSNPSGMGLVSVESRLEFQGTISGTDESRATDMREKDRMGIFGNTLSYAGSYGRVASESIGRDLNPLGRGDGVAYVGGWEDLGQVAPRLPKAQTNTGQGNSVNNTYISDDEARENEEECKRQHKNRETEIATLETRINEFCNMSTWEPRKWLIKLGPKSLNDAYCMGRLSYYESLYDKCIQNCKNQYIPFVDIKTFCSDLKNLLNSLKSNSDLVLEGCVKYKNAKDEYYGCLEFHKKKCSPEMGFNAYQYCIRLAYEACKSLWEDYRARESDYINILAEYSRQEEALYDKLGTISQSLERLKNCYTDCRDFVRGQAKLEGCYITFQQLEWLALAPSQQIRPGQFHRPLQDASNVRILNEEKNCVSCTGRAEVNGRL